MRLLHTLHQGRYGHYQSRDLPNISPALVEDWNNDMLSFRLK
jgi:hypothetical protein